MILIKKIVVINGLPRSGKDTFAQLASRYAVTTNFSSVDFVKEVAKFAGWDGEKTPESRLFLSELKNLLTKYADIPYNKTVDEIDWFYGQPEQELLFIHVREPNEIARLVRMFGAVTVLVKRPENQQVISNDSDKYVESYNYDFVLNNDSDLDALDKKAKGFVDYLRRN